MAGKTDPSRMSCIVALLPAGAANRLSLDMVRVGSGYEAAAELLSGPVSALLVDLAALPAAHASLLKLAARLNVPVVAFGTVSAALNGSALAGVRLVGAEDVPETLREIMAVKPTIKPVTSQFVAAIAEAEPSVTEREPIKVPVSLIDKPLSEDELDALLRD